MFNLITCWEIIWGRIKQKIRERTHGHGKQCGDCSREECGWVEREKGIDGINGDKK